MLRNGAHPLTISIRFDYHKFNQTIANPLRDENDHILK